MGAGLDDGLGGLFRGSWGLRGLCLGRRGLLLRRRLLLSLLRPKLTRLLVSCLDLPRLEIEVVEGLALFLEPASLASLPVITAHLDDTAMALNPFLVCRCLLLLLMPRLHRLVPSAEYAWLLSLPLLDVLQEVALYLQC